MKTLEDFEPGNIIRLGYRSVDEAEIIAFGQAYDPQIFHTDAVAAQDSVFGGLVASGWHTAGICMRLVCDKTRAAGRHTHGLCQGFGANPVALQTRSWCKQAALGA